MREGAVLGQAMQGYLNRAQSSSGSLGMMGASAAPAEFLPIDSAMNRMGEAIEDLHLRISTLEDRLRPVMAPRNEKCRDDCEAPAPSLLSSRMSLQANGVLGAVARINTILDSLEL